MAALDGLIEVVWGSGATSGRSDDVAGGGRGESEVGSPGEAAAVNDGCGPAATAVEGPVEGFVGVTNPPPPLDSSMLPSGPPARGLACQYYGLNGHPFALEQKTVMDSAAANAFARNVGRLPLGHVAGGVVSCPSDDGSATVVALDYPDGRTVDLWIATTGCSYTSNGYISASGAPPV